MYKAIGFIACVSVMAASLYLFSGGAPSQSLSAQTENANVDSYNAVARRFMNEARQLAQQGKIQKARRLAETASSLSATWNEGEQTPDQFLAALGKQASASTNPLEATAAGDWPAADTTADDNPFAEPANGSSLAVTDLPLPENASEQMVNRHRAVRLMKEARAAARQGDYDAARARVMQARSFKVSWGLWEERPEHLLAEIDRLDKTHTFLADAAPQANAFEAAPAEASTVEASYQQAQQLLSQAKAALNEGNLSRANQLVDEADRLQATYSLWEDSPTTIRQEIARLQQGGATPTDSFPVVDSAIPTNQFAQQAQLLLKEARTELAAGRLTAARQKAEQAAGMNVAYSLMEDRPELVLSEISNAMNGQSFNAATQVQSVATTEPNPFAEMENGAIDMTPATTVQNSIVTVGSEGTASELLSEGMLVARQGDPAAAKQILMKAWDKSSDLNASQRQTLFTAMQQLAEYEVVSLASGTQESPFDIPVSSEMDPMAKADPLQDAAAELDVKFAKLRTEVLNAGFRAARLKETDPTESLSILENALASVNASGLPEESSQVLSRHLQRSQKNIELYMEQRAPLLANEERNRAVKEQLQTEVENQIRIEQEFAELTNQFNELMKQKRYAEAELVAKKAMDLNSELPQATIMVETAKLKKQVDFIADVKTRKADSALDQFNKIEESFAMPVVDYGLPSAKSWRELTDRRAAYGRTDSRIRTESDLRIEKSLSEQVSLHFENVPLKSIIRNIASTHDINIMLDIPSIESEGLSVDQNISINVDGITLRSAMNLLLQQAGGLVYNIEDEVLKVTNRLAQDTKLEPRVYNVADLVVPMSLQQERDVFDNPALQGLGSASGNGLFQVDDSLAVEIGGNGYPGRGGSGRKRRNDGPDFDSLVDLITTTVEPGAWDIDGGAGTLAGNENTLSLVIRQTPAVHEEIVSLLKQLRKLQDLQVTVEVRFVSVTDRFFERIGVDFDFNVQDSIGDVPGIPAFGSSQGGQAGQAGQAGQNGQTGQTGQNGQTGQTTGALFDNFTRNNTSRDDFSGQSVGLASPDSFTNDYDIQFRQGSFELGVPDFGNFNPDAGIQVGMAILSDIEAFFFIQAAQADERANIMFAPKVTLFNGQTATVTQSSQRPFVLGLIPVVANGAVGFQPIVQAIPTGIQLNVLAVISADRRYVRLSLAPQFQQVTDIFTFSFATGGAGGGAGIGGGQGGGGFGQGGGQAGGQGGFGGGGGFGGIGGGGFGGGGAGGGGIGGGGVGGQQGGQAGGQQGGQAGAAGGTLTVQQPVQENVTVSTTVSVPDGGTVLLGGVKRLSESRNMAGVPILNKIPYVSRLFKNSGVGRETESLMLMVTPRIIIHEEEEELILGNSGQ